MAWRSLGGDVKETICKLSEKVEELNLHIGSKWRIIRNAFGRGAMTYHFHSA
jgi:hypothetical protein